MFYVLSQNYQHFWKNDAYASWSKLSEKLKNGIRILEEKVKRFMSC